MLFQFNEIYELISPSSLADNVLKCFFFLLISLHISISSLIALLRHFPRSVFLHPKRLKFYYVRRLLIHSISVEASASLAKSEFILFFGGKAFDSLWRVFGLFRVHLPHASSSFIREIFLAKFSTRGKHQSVDCCILMAISLPLDLCSSLPPKSPAL